MTVAINGADLLDETARFMARHVVAQPEQVDAAMLYATATHGMGTLNDPNSSCFVTFGRLLFWSADPESGKTVGMTVTAALSANPIDTEGTRWALTAEMADSKNSAKPVPTLYRDEISDVFGLSGTGGTSNPLGKYLRKGYKMGATDSRSTNRVKEEWSIFTPFIMTGLKSAVPRDVRTRCISIEMHEGKPERPFDVRSGEPKARQLAKVLSAAVRNNREQIADFRANGIHPKMTNRKVEVWEPLIAVAYALGGVRWLKRALRAFEVVAVAGVREEDLLTPEQAILLDVVKAAHSKPELVVKGFIPTRAITSALRSKYRTTDDELACMLRDALPIPSYKFRPPGEKNQQRGYPLDALLSAWNAVKPVMADDTPDEELIPDDPDPFTPDDSDEEYVPTPLHVVNENK